MIHYLLVLPVALPILFGIALLAMPIKEKKTMLLMVEAAVIVTSLILFGIIFSKVGRGEGAILFSLTGDLKVFFKLDGMGIVFTALVAFLWPLATLYAFEYMEHDDRQRSFFAFYTMTFGVTVGIAMAGNFVTLYLFYELLTLVTFPLVLHYRDRASRRAARKYLYYSIAGAALAFVGMVFVMLYGSSTDFVLGGVLSETVEKVRTHRNLLLAVYVVAFIGFGVKAAMVPMQKWLPSASVAPTPVTALLHAVAVVKAGAFSILRLTYYSFGVEFLRGTWAQIVVAVLAMITVIYGSTMAVREVHFKKRLAYSTISNLSYILVAASMMSELGLIAALSHLIFHAIMKICGFFCAGAVMHKAKKNYVYELNGLAKAMPITFICFTIAAMSLTGIPPFAGFISKWNIAQAGMQQGSFLGIAAIIVILYSALMTGIYMFSVIVRAFFPAKGEETEAKVNLDPSWKMLLPIVLFAVLMIGLGLYSQPLMHFLESVARGAV